jgi:uncharacterized protein YjbI with pentapeptide repeats
MAKSTCACKAWQRRACAAEGLYRQSEGSQYCVLHYPGRDKIEDFTKALEGKLSVGDLTFCGVWFPESIFFSTPFSGKVDFMGAHFTCDASFAVEFQHNANFSMAQFDSIVYFDEATFKEKVTFAGARFADLATFRNSHFESGANFASAHFQHAFFEIAEFSENATFGNAEFSAVADFNAAHFVKGADFTRAQFNSTADFHHTRFNGDGIFDNVTFHSNADFQWARFKNEPKPANVSADIETPKVAAGGPPAAESKPSKISFVGSRFTEGATFEMNDIDDSALVSFAGAIFEKPERVMFHTVRLRPYWFINVDPRRFNFISADWGFLDNRHSTRREIAALEKHEVGYSTRILEVTFRQLAVNAEENSRYEEAANFRYMAMEMKRFNRWRKFDFLRLSWWYWLLSGYGERVERAFWILVLIWLLFSVIYWTGDATWWEPKQIDKVVTVGEEKDRQQHPMAKSLSPVESGIYSAYVMALQKPQPAPANKRARVAVLLETILGPVQAALLALAIRRKFMR